MGTHYRATATDLASYADLLEGELELIQEVSRQPHQQRTYRTFRYSDVKEFAPRITPKRWETWIAANVEGAREKIEKRAGEGPGPYRLTLEQIHQMLDDFKMRPRRPEGARPIIAAVAAFKGGSSKTTTAVHFATYLAQRGYRVLLVDLDMQGSATRMLGMNPAMIGFDETFAPAYFDPETELKTRPTHIDGLHLLPASMALSEVDIELALAFRNQDSAAARFYQALQIACARLGETYDFILIDTPPAFSLTQISILWGVNSLIVPVPPEGLDAGGTVDFLRQTAKLIQVVDQWEGVEKVWDPFMAVHCRDKGGGHVEVIKGCLGSALGIHRLSESVPDTRAVTNAQDMFKSVFEATPQEVNSKSLKTARENFSKVFSLMEEIFESAWRDQVGVAA